MTTTNLTMTEIAAQCGFNSIYSQKDQENQEEQKIARTVHTEKAGGHEIASWFAAFFFLKESRSAVQRRSPCFSYSSLQHPYQRHGGLRHFGIRPTQMAERLLWRSVNS